MKHLNRRVILKKRNRLTKKEIKKKSEIIKKKLFNSKEYKKAKTIMFYTSFGSEVHTIDMIKESLNLSNESKKGIGKTKFFQRKKTVCIPIVKEDKLIASKIQDIKELNKKNKYGILEVSTIKKIPIKDIDLVLIPGIVFDKNNHRIGYGKGYYDKFLKNFKKDKIGLAFKLQILEIIPKNDWDVQLDKVISE